MMPEVISHWTFLTKVGS